MTPEKLLNFYNINYYTTNPRISREVPTWDGNSLCLDNCEDVYWAIHEVAHCLTSLPDLLILPNYGLGTDPGGGIPTRIATNVLKIHNTTVIKEENIALIAALALILKHNLENTDEATIHIKDYGYSLFTTNQIENAKTQLLKRKVFTRKEINHTINFLEQFL